MKLPIVSIVGRPNVGKSSLFNRIVGRRMAVVDDMAGVTRDRNYSTAAWNGQDFELVDTGGFQPNSHDAMASDVNEQVSLAVAESAAIIFLVDVQTGPTDLDLFIAQRLRKEAHNKVIVTANKAESHKSVLDLGEFMAMGFGEPTAVSGLHGTGVGNLLDDVVERIKAAGQGGGQNVEDTTLRVAVLGRPNAGKSSLVNLLLNEKRMIVSPVPGTTRDAIDSSLMYKGQPIVLVDTAGLRKKSQVKLDIEYYSNVRALAAARTSNVCVLMADATDGFGEQDMKIVAQILDMRKGLMICLNKWDLVEKDGKTYDKMVAQIRSRYMQLRHVPFLAISALTGQRIAVVLDTAIAIRQRMFFRVPSGEFKRKCFEWFRENPHPFVSNTDIRFLGGKQVAASFPLFTFFVSNHSLIQKAYERYLANKIHDTYNFAGCPVVLEYKAPARPRRRSYGEQMTGRPNNDGDDQ